jgi:hypothetical protein
LEEISLVLVAFLSVFLPAALPWRRNSFLFFGVALFLYLAAAGYFFLVESRQVLRPIVPMSVVALVLAGVFLLSLLLRAAIVVADRRLSRDRDSKRAVDA